MSHDLETDHHYLDETINLNLRQLSQEQLSKFEGYAAEIFSALGMKVGEYSHWNRFQIEGNELKVFQALFQPSRSVSALIFIG